jgi:hypothetical protein
MDGINTTRLGDIYVRREADIVKVRDRVRRLAREMRFDTTTQIKITTAVSELTRNIYEYARSGAITLAVAERAGAMQQRACRSPRATTAPASTKLNYAPSCAASTVPPPASASASAARAA